MILKYLNKIKDVANAATDGPWRTTPINVDGWQSHKMISGYQRSVKFRDFIKANDAEFIAESRVMVPFLYQSLLDCFEVMEKNQINSKDLDWLNERLTKRIQSSGPES